MDSTNLTPEQADKMYHSLFRLANYLIRLRERMHRVPRSSRLDKSALAEAKPGESFVHQLPFSGVNSRSSRHAQLS